MRTVSTIATALALVLAACGGSDDGGSSDASDDATERIVELFTSVGAPEDEARCVADNLDDDITPADVEAYIEAIENSDDSTDLLEESDTDVALAVGLAVQECGL